MIIDNNASQIVFQIFPKNQNGQENEDIVSGSIRLYSIVAGSEVDAMASTPLVNIGEAWRYVLDSPVLDSGQYFAEYSLVDGSAVTTLFTEDISVVKYDADITRLLDFSEGNWSVQNYQMIFYKRDGTELVRYNLKDLFGANTMDDVFRREKVV